MRSNSRTKHVEKNKNKLKKNDFYDSNNNDLKDEQNHRFEKKETLI